MNITEELMLAGKKMKMGTSINGKETLHKQSPEILLSSPRSKVKTVLKFARVHIAGPGRIATIIAPAGGGKTQTIEACVSSFLNSHVDTLGFEVLPIDERVMLWLDTERTQDEILDGFERIKRRIVLEHNPELVMDDRFVNVRCHSLINYSDPTDKLRELERLCADLNPFIVLLDGGGDLVADINDPGECVPVVGKLIALANDFEFTLLTTVHPNPGGSNDNKPRGVLGSELVRKSESVILLKRAPDDRDIRILTTDFMHGKNRSASDRLEHYFKWSDTQKMFTSCDYSAPVKSTKSEKQEEAFTSILEGKELRYSDLLNELQAKGFCSSIPTAKRWIKQAIDRKILTVKNEYYRYQN